MGVFVQTYVVICLLPLLWGYNISVDYSFHHGSLKHFWRSTGFCPPDPHQRAGDYLLSKDVLINLSLISSLPHDGIRHVRIHWLLDLIGVESDNSTYSFTKLDKFMMAMRERRLVPGFELMGNPGNVFTDFNNVHQQSQWKKLIRQIASRYVEKYGLSWVSQWNFESWNEPDHKDFDSLNFTISGYLNYWSASYDGLKSVSSLLRLGGPGGSCRPPHFIKFCYSLLNYCNTTSKIDYISFHKKGNTDVESIIKQEISFIQLVRRNYVNLRHLHFYNDEADPLKGWWKGEEWRGDVRYASMVAMSVILHQKHFKSRLFISNDNAFLNYHPHYFNQRTLFARFQMNNTSPPHSQFIWKPVYSVMGMLALLGNTVINNYYNSSMHLGLLLTVRKYNHSKQLCVLLVRGSDNKVREKVEVFNVKIEHLELKDAKYVIYTLNNNETNPMKIWENQNQPVFPSKIQRMMLRKVQAPRMTGPKKYDNTVFSLSLPIPSVTLVSICSNAQEAPEKVVDVRVYNVTSGEVLITWSDRIIKTRCIWTYEVEHRNKFGKSFERINQQNTFFNSFQFAIASPHAEDFVRGLYRVRVKDYWGRHGPYSDIVSYE